MENKKQNCQPPDKTKAVFKMLVYFKNGTARTFYNYHTSYNAELKKVIECERTALNKLRKLEQWKFKDTYKTILIIYIPTNEIIEKFVYGRQNFATDYTFSFQNGKVIFVPAKKLKVA